MKEPTKYAYFVINDSDDLEELQNCLAPFGGVEAMNDVIIDYALDKRRIIDLIKYCNEHDIIYTPYLARLGKSLKELYSIVSFANQRYVSFIFCDKPQISFNVNNPVGSIYIANLQWAVELTNEIRSHNIRSSLSSISEKIKHEGSYIAHSTGTRLTHFGNEKGCDMTAAIKVSVRKRKDSAIIWRKNSKAYKRALDKAMQGWTLTQIVKDISDLYDIDPNNYCTPKGCKPTQGTISRWLSEAKNKENNEK